MSNRSEIRRGISAPAGTAAAGNGLCAVSCASARKAWLRYCSLRPRSPYRRGGTIHQPSANQSAEFAGKIRKISYYFRQAVQFAQSARTCLSKLPNWSKKHKKTIDNRLKIHYNYYSRRKADSAKVLRVYVDSINWIANVQARLILCRILRVACSLITGSLFSINES